MADLTKRDEIWVRNNGTRQKHSSYPAAQSVSEIKLICAAAKTLYSRTPAPEKVYIYWHDGSKHTVKRPKTA